MDRVVAAAADLAQPGDTVLLAPGCASMDMFAELRRARRRLRRGGAPAPRGLTDRRRTDDGRGGERDDHRPPTPPSAPAATATPPAARLVRRRSAHALDRPLTSYYLLLGASALLLTIGLVMVLSASSVYSFEHHDGDSYAVVKRQLMWVVLGIPCALGRLAAAAPGDPRSSPGSALHRLGGAARADPDRRWASTVNGNTELAGARPARRSSPRRSPSSRSCCGPPTSTPTRSGCSATGTTSLIPVVPVHARRHRAGRRRPATSAPRWCCSRSCSAMLWVVGAPAAAVRRLALTVVGVVALCLATHQRRAAASG